MNNEPDHFDDDYSEFEIESQAPPPPDTDAESSRGEGHPEDGPEEGLLDQVLTSTDRLCCARGKDKTDDIESGNAGEGNLVPEAPATENGENFQDGNGNEAGDLSAAPKALARDPSAVKESVEIKAHFDEKEEDLTIISDNGLDTTAESEKIGSFVSEEQQAARRRRLQFILGGIAALILVVGLGAGLGTRNKTQEASAMQAVNDSSSTKVNSGEETSAPEEGNSTGYIITTATYVLIPTTDAPVNETTATDAPVESPAACVNSVSVNANCFEFFQDEILATFNLCDPVSLDWVALYPEGSTITNLEYPRLAWSYSCGSQACTGSVPQGSVSLGFDTAPGTYQAYLFSNVGGDQGAPYAAIASSEPFEITVGTCN